jgi:hypothetical protein
LPLIYAIGVLLVVVALVKHWPFEQEVATTPIERQLANLLTSPAGLASGTVWNDGGVLAVVPPSSYISGYWLFRTVP